MNVLILSLDQSLLKKTGVGDTLKRFQAYAQHLNSLFCLIPTTSPSRQYKIKNIQLLPAYSASKFGAYQKLLTLTQKMLGQLDLIVTNDAVLGFIAILARGLSDKPKIQINVFGASVTNQHWYRQRLLNRVYAPFIKFALSHTDSIRTDSTIDAQALINQLGIKPQKIVTIPVVPSPGIKKLYLTAKPSTQFSQYHPHLLLTIGHLVPKKDHKNLIQAAKILHRQNIKFHWLIVGQGPQESKIRSQIHQLKLQDHITLVGQLPYQDLPGLVKSTNIFVSTSYLEGLPRVLMEACFASVPIVSTDTSGVHDLVKNNYSGKIVPVKDPQALAEAISYLLTHPQTAATYAQRAHRHALKYLDYQSNLNKLIQSWKDTIKP